MGSQTSTINKSVATELAEAALPDISDMGRPALRVFTETDGLPQRSVTAMTIDAKGYLWVGTQDGIAYYNGRIWTVVHMPNRTDSRTVHKIYSTADGAIWVCTDGAGLFRLSDGKWRVFDRDSGLPSNRVLSVCESRDDERSNTIWVGTDRGLASLKNGEWRLFDSASGLPADTVSSIIELRSSMTEDGLPQNECVEGASMVDSLSRVWAGTVEGAAMFDPRKEVIDRQPKPLYIERTLVGNTPRHLEQNASLAYNENQLAFEFALLSYFRESASQFRTQMVGLEDKPTVWSADYKRDFSYLPDGDFALKVWGRDYAGNISGPAEIAFEVRPAPWRTWWAYALYALAAGLLFSSVAYSIHRYRVARLIEIERVRTRIATDLHDDIGSSLSQISILSEVVMQNTSQEGSHVSEPLTRIAAASREMVDSMSDIVWAINPNRDNLRDLVHRMRRFASDILGARNIDFHFTAPATQDNIKLGADMRRQIFLVFKESVNNLAKYSRCTKADIKFDLDGNHLVLEVSDNGRGFDISRESDGHGLISMKQSAGSLGGSLDIRSTIDKGTTISLRVPVERGRGWRLWKSPPE